MARLLVLCLAGPDVAIEAVGFHYAQCAPPHEPANDWRHPGIWHTLELLRCTVPDVAHAKKLRMRNP